MLTCFTPADRHYSPKFGPLHAAQFDPATGIPKAVPNPAFVEATQSLLGGFGPFGRRDVVVSCGTGMRGYVAQERLKGAGISAASIRGGFKAWRAAGLPWNVVGAGDAPAPAPMMPAM